MERDPPLQVYCDYEALTDAEGNQTPILLCAETDEQDDTLSFYGKDCTSPFFDWLKGLAVDQDGHDRNFIALFHNFKGYDGMFLLQYWYAHHREVTNQITVGTKILSFQSDQLTFKDSLCFPSRSPSLVFPPPSASRNCVRDSSLTNSTPSRLKTTRDPCHRVTHTTPTACGPKRKPSSNGGTMRRSPLTTTLSCDARWKPTPSQT